uniref:Uncharacterized protein n=1 Tax=Tanacetum cinerariifolium TaxID=118510 RepID=A0A699HWD6_TANCI|nr:hypothetical protein [Tanacetum cinerariifolium]
MIDDLDDDEGVTLVDETQGRNDQDMFDTSILDDEEVVAEKEVSAADPVTTTNELVTTIGIKVSTVAIISQILMNAITLAKALIDIKTLKRKAKEIVMQEPSEKPTPTPIVSSQQPSMAKDKDKAKMIEPEKPLKDQIMIDEEVARNLEAELEEEEDARKKHFAALRAKEKRSKPPTKAQKRKIMSTYLKNMAGYKHGYIVGEGSGKAAEGSSKRARDDVTIEATPLSSKLLAIVDYKIYEEGRKSFFKIIRADARFKKTKPVNDMDNLLFQTLKTMFEHHNMVYYLLVERMYPLTRNTLHQMWNDVRLQVDYEVEMAYDLLRLIWRQISESYVPE